MNKIKTFFLAVFFTTAVLATAQNRVVSLPSRYDISYATPAKNQVFSGPCWLFAANALLETHIKKTTGTEIILSENHARFAIFGSRFGTTPIDRRAIGGGNQYILPPYWMRSELGCPVLTQDDYLFGDQNFTNWNHNAHRRGRVTNVHFVAGYDAVPAGNIYDYTSQIPLNSLTWRSGANPYWANIFDCEEENAVLKEVTIFLYENAVYNIYVGAGDFTRNAAEDNILLNSALSNKAGELRVNSSESLSKYRGFHTIKLDTPIPVGRKSFTIVVEGRSLESGQLRFYYLQSRSDSGFTIYPRQSYFSASTALNKTWTDNHSFGNFWIYAVVAGSSGQSSRQRLMDR